MRLTAISLFCLIATGSHALAELALDPDCIMAPDSETSCSPIVACIANETMIVGNAVGWDTGTLEGETSTGAACTGTWDAFQQFAEFECDDGQSGQVVYWHQDDLTGTALGSGATGEGRPIETWSGNDLATYVMNDRSETALVCGETRLPLN